MVYASCSSLKMVRPAAYEQAAALAVMGGVSALVLLLGMLGVVQRMVRAIPVWLIQAFNFATAVSIVVDAVEHSVVGCIAVSEAATWSIYVAGVCVGCGWKAVLEWWIARQGRRKASPLLGAFGLPMAAAVSWAMYEASPLSGRNGGFCPRFGPQALRIELLPMRADQVFHTLVAGMPLPLFAATAL